jgi:hypothetical protein
MSMNDVLVQSPLLTQTTSVKTIPHLALVQRICDSTLRLLQNANWLPSVETNEILFHAWPKDDRLILIFDAAVFKQPDVLGDGRLARRLRSGLGHRRVAVTLHDLLYVQIGYAPTPQHELQSQTLNLNEQPSPLHVPIGLTHKGSWWLSITDMDSCLIGGARRMGKTNLLHGWIAALLRGGQTELYLWDGKGGTEFHRYARHPQANILSSNPADLLAALTQIHQELQDRLQLFQDTGVTHLSAYNQQTRKALPLIVIMIDEAALLPTEAQELLGQLVALGGAGGIHPVIATQRPDADTVQGVLKSNLSTRIALPVPDRQTSQIILGRAGAEKLPKWRGRLLTYWEARPVEAQSFFVELGPEPARQINPRLLDFQEQQMVQVALALGGWFHIQKIAAELGIGDEAVTSQARQWEEIGWLTGIQYDKNTRSPRRLGRRLTNTLVDLAGLDGFTD